MSDAIFPMFQGLSWPIIRTPTNSTTIKTAVSGREYRKANWASPKWAYQLTWDVLRQGTVHGVVGYTELSSLMGFINARQGSFDSFLYPDPDDGSVSLQQVGLGDGVTTVFQLVRTFGSYVEPVYDLNGAPIIFVDGAIQTGAGVNYTLLPHGVISFVSAPPSGKIVAWTGSYYWRCRFQVDSADFYKNFPNLWEMLQTPLSFITTKA